MKTINEMTRKEIEAVPDRGWNENIGEFNSMIILPSRRLHDSGYRCMDFVACIDLQPIKKLSGCSDVIHINGIGGYGKWNGSIPMLVPAISWNIDCLKVSGLLHIFTGGKLTCGEALSSFEIYSHNQKLLYE